MSGKIAIERESHTTHGAYRVDIDGAKAELTWQAKGGARIADHTFVAPELRGQGIAAQLVEALVEDARQEDFTIVPQCSYVAAAFRRHPEWRSLRAPTES
ncbi:GNAT family N-acetyltransferase [Altericroceibacterium endophyticum]|uniref:GNAT family N-acetyltransferase n=1 Tax=Altericroceibacterium endophyticum TaxID=1808508 RepID=A0A6I4T6V0_9SPHN|nr:GNAT family N-acetyltransferase [Altericroceibacterium endophyticum]MXO65733.1 GNAT family N-acetyltransferase [Altericroceibacterium endophyticum]